MKDLSEVLVKKRGSLVHRRGRTIQAERKCHVHRTMKQELQENCVCSIGRWTVMLK